MLVYAEVFVNFKMIHQVQKGRKVGLVVSIYLSNISTKLRSWQNTFNDIKGGEWQYLLMK